MTHVLGEGGADNDKSFKLNVMQLLHGAYNIQNQQEINGLKYLRNYFDDLEDGDAMKFQKLEEPILTRWWLVGTCACSFKKRKRF